MAFAVVVNEYASPVYALSKVQDTHASEIELATKNIAEPILTKNKASQTVTTITKKIRQISCNNLVTKTLLAVFLTACFSSMIYYLVRCSPHQIVQTNDKLIPKEVQLTECDSYRQLNRLFKDGSVFPMYDTLRGLMAHAEEDLSDDAVWDLNLRLNRVEWSFTAKLSRTLIINMYYCSNTAKGSCIDLEGYMISSIIKAKSLMNDAIVEGIKEANITIDITEFNNYLTTMASNLCAIADSYGKNLDCPTHLVCFPSLTGNETSNC